MIENHAKSHYGTFGDPRDVYIFEVADVLPDTPFFYHRLRDQIGV